MLCPLFPPSAAYPQVSDLSSSTTSIATRSCQQAELQLSLPRRCGHVGRRVPPVCRLGPMCGTRTASGRASATSSDPQIQSTHPEAEGNEEDPEGASDWVIFCCRVLGYCGISAKEPKWSHGRVLQLPLGDVRSICGRVVLQTLG